MRQNGFTLIELLMALLIFSVGIAGLAALQSIALNNVRKTYYYSLALSSITNMSERILSNMVGARNSHYNSPVATAHASCNTTTGCTALEMAENDFYEWKTNVEDELPNGAVAVCIDSLETTACNGLIVDGIINYILTVTWSEGSQNRNIIFPLKITA